MTRFVSLNAFGYDLEIDLETGGSVSAYLNNGEHILRPAPTGSRDVLAMGAFPLVPFSGRIKNGMARFEGHTLRLAPNLPPEPHCIHGQGWRNVWRLGEITDDRLTIHFDWTAADWPWSYTTSQTFTLSPGGLLVEQSVTNMGDNPMPTGLGWHPYFPREDAVLTCDVTAFWPNTDDYVPGMSSVNAVTQHLNAGHRVADLELDNAFTAGGGASVIHWPSRNTTVTLSVSDNLKYWVIYVPRGEDFFCVEPVSHLPDAINRVDPAAHGLAVVAPGEALSCWTRLTVD